MRKEEIRRAWVAWLAGQQWNYTINLNTNRDFGKIKPWRRREVGKEYFRRFCQLLDRKTLGTRYSWHPDLRAHIIVAPEHINSNYHLQGFISFEALQWMSAGEAQNRISECWAKAVPGGSALLGNVYDSEGWAGYISKEIGRPGWDKDVMLSEQFWPSNE